MQLVGISLMRERRNLAELLRKCSRNFLYDEGKQVHGALIRIGYDYDLMMNTDLVDMYVKCGRVEKARAMFDRMPERDVVCWTALMCGYIKDSQGKASLFLFNEMRYSNVRPNEYTFSINIKACGILHAVETGKQIHGMCHKSGVEWYAVVGNSIIDMYSKCGRIGEAERVFNEMPVRSLVTWNAMIAGYAIFESVSDKSLHLLREMQKKGQIPDDFTLSSTIKVCRGIGAIREGRQIHAFLIRQGYLISSHNILAGALVDLYAQCGYLSQAQQVFGQMKTKSVISWTALTLGCAREGKLSEAIDLFRWFTENSIPIDDFVLSSIISVFADFALVELGRQMHSYTLKIPYGLEISVTNSILDMYLKCGLTEKAEKLFRDMPEKNVVSYTVMITGYGKHGLGKEAVQLFKKMMIENIKPDDVSYLAVLSACSHSGLIEESQECFTRLCNSYRPRVEHYACMVDILGRTGRLQEAQNLINNMPLRPNVGIWQTLLSACRLHKDFKMGRKVGEILLRLDGDNLVNYVMLSNMFADVGCWKECERLRELVKGKGSKKEAGCSWIEINNGVHFFCCGDETHPLTKNIYGVLREMQNMMKQEMDYGHEGSFV